MCVNLLIRRAALGLSLGKYANAITIITVKKWTHMSRLILQIKRNAPFEAARHDRVVGHDEGVCGHATAQEVAHHDEELDALEVAVEVAIEIRVTTALDLLLHGKLLGGRLVGRSVVLGVVIASDTELRRQCLCHLETNGKVGLYAEFWQCQHIIVGRSLHEDGIVPCEKTCGEALPSLKTEHRNLLVILLWQEIIAGEIYVVVDVFDAGTD